MWIVRLALRRPYTFVVVASDLDPGPLAVLRTPTDIFPNINIPVVSVIWNFTGLAPQEMANRIVTISERSLTTVVNDIEHIESQSLNGVGVIKVFFQPGANIRHGDGAGHGDRRRRCCEQLPPGTTPPLIISYNASSVPILQLGAVEHDAVRAAAVRLRAELHPHAAGDRPGRGVPSRMAASSGRCRWTSNPQRCRRRACRRSTW